MSDNYWAEEADRLHLKWIKALTEIETLKAEISRLKSSNKLSIYNPETKEFETRFEEPK